MADSTKIRRFARLLEQDSAVVWVINHQGVLVFVSGGCAAWLGIEGDQLIGRRSRAGTAVSDETADRLAACLSPPPGFERRGTASLRIQPPASKSHRPTPREVRYVRVGASDSAFTIGVAGLFDDRHEEPEIQDAVAIRQRLDLWRQKHSILGAIATIGETPAAKRVQRRIKVAGSVRTHLGIFQPPGGGGESIAIKLHQESAPGEPFIQIDGPLMDPELLDSALMPLLNRLSDSEKSLGTVLLKEISHTSVDSQRRLDSLLASFPDRLRLIAIADLRDQEIAYPTNSEDLIPRDEQTSGIIVPELMDRLDSVQVICQPLSRRVNDIHLIAGALLDRQQASGQSTAERISRPALDAMVNYPWPRNFSELEDAIIHACRTAVSESIRLEDLPLSIRSYRSPAPKNTIKPLPLDDALALHEQQLLTEAMEQAGGNRSEAARQLGISRSRLIRKLDQDSNREGRSST